VSPVTAMAGSVLALALLAPSSYSAEKATVKDRLIALRDRVAAITQGKETVQLNESDRSRIPTPLTDNDKMAFKAFLEFSATVNDGDLEAVAGFAVSKDGASIRALLVGLLVDRGRFDAAASAVVVDLVAKPKDREYRLWKWWEWTFSERKNYKELSRSFSDALLRQFDTGSAETKLAIAEVFGKGAKEAKLSLQQFKDAIQYDRQLEPEADHRGQKTPVPANNDQPQSPPSAGHASRHG
jgi:hypothetical protein